MWLRDVRHALRVMARNPGFSAIAAGSLALGIGANAAIFSFADAVLFRPLPVARPGEVVSVRSRIQDSATGISYASVSWLDYMDYRERAGSFDGLIAYNQVTVALAARAAAPPRVTLAMLVSGNFLRVLGVQPALGRDFRPEEDAVPGRDPVAIVSHAFWVAELGGDPGVLGRALRLNGVSLTIVGVAPESFWGLEVYTRPVVYVPTAMAPALLGSAGERLLERREARGMSVKGRLRRGVGVEQADAELRALAAQLEQAYPDTNRNQGVIVRTELQSRVERSPDDAAITTMASALAVLVLLIACANVSSLLLSRAAARARELAVRLALGVGRARLVRQLLTENLVVALLGGLLGLVLAAAGVQFFAGMPYPSDLPVVLDVRLDVRVLLFSLAAAAASVLVFGLTPAWRATRTDLVAALKAGDGGIVARGRLRGGQVLVVLQLVLSLVLLTSTASLMHGLQGAALVSNPGFRRDGLLTAGFDPTVLRYPAERTRAFYRELVARAPSLPGVESVALTYGVPLGDRVDVVNFIPEGYVVPEGRTSLATYGTAVGPRYFELLDIPLVQGRAFTENDDADAPRVLIVNEVLARKYWPGVDPIGKRVRLEGPDGPWAEVVGVARTHKYLWIGEAATEFAYRPFAQSDQRRMVLLLRARGEAAALAAPLRELVRSIDADVPMHDVRTMSDLYEMRAVSMPRMIVETVGALGLLGLALALVGLYGLMAYSVNRRTREIGVRMAIGAEPGQVLRLVLHQGLGLALLGIAIGLVASFAATPILGAVVAGVTRADLVAFVVVPVTLLAITALAVAWPARRASRVDPVKALRFE